MASESRTTSETFEWLRRTGCDIAQGYLFARPMPAEAMAAWLLERAGAAVAAGQR